MTTAILTAGGRAVAKPETTNELGPMRYSALVTGSTFEDWMAHVQKMLDRAAAIYPKRSLLLRQREWLERNPFHDRQQERWDAYWAATWAEYDEENEVQWLCEEVWRIQARLCLSDRVKLRKAVDLPLDIAHPLRWCWLSMGWGGVAIDTGISDFDEVVQRWKASVPADELRRVE